MLKLVIMYMAIMILLVGATYQEYAPEKMKKYSIDVFVHLP